MVTPETLVNETENTTTTFTSRIDIDEETRAQLIALLNQNLADLLDLHSQTKQAHWNVRGIHFFALHELFDEAAAVLPEFIDTVAERANMLGGYAVGTLRMTADASRLDEFPSDVVDGDEVARVLADRWGHYSNLVREAIDVADDLDDDGTEDVLTEISRAIDKYLWFIEAHLQG